MVASSAQTGVWSGAEYSRARENVLHAFTRRRPVRILLAVLGWTALGVLFALPAFSTKSWHDELRIYLAQFWSWGLITPAIVAVDRRLPFGARDINKRALAHLGFSIVFTEVYFVLFTAMRAAMGETPWSSLEPAQLLSPGVLGWQLWSWLIYWVVAGAIQAYGYYERYMSSELNLERLEHSFVEARLNALRTQLDPHFLFNALNTISSHVERDPKLTRRMIEHLGDLLRLSLESRDKQEVPLFEELAFLGHYLAIQKIRFGEQLRVVMEIAPGVRHARVPCLVIQPLVENAIRHGISRRASGGTITVRAMAVGDRLELRVLDDGVGLPPNWSMEHVAEQAAEKPAGLGLSITRERIAGLHPHGASRFSVANRAEGGVAVEIDLPLRLVGEDDDGSATV